jgi:hypothetical protein
MTHIAVTTLHFLVTSNEPNKLEHYKTLDLKGFSGTNSQAYWAHS